MHVLLRASDIFWPTYAADLQHKMYNISVYIFPSVNKSQQFVDLLVF